MSDKENKDYELQVRRNPQSLLEEYPRKGKQFILGFETITLCFFAIVCTLQLFLL